MAGVFCEIYGDNIRNNVIEFFLENQSGDFAASSLSEQLEISRPKAYEFIERFEKQGYLLKSRIIGRTQLYKLNKENKHVKLLMKSFNECLQLVVEEHSEKHKHTTRASSIGVASAKRL